MSSVRGFVFRSSRVGVVQSLLVGRVPLPRRGLFHQIHLNTKSSHPQVKEVKSSPDSLLEVMELFLSRRYVVM